jgi:hypothetical protein
MVLRTANRTDTNFTFFGILIDAKLFEGISLSLISKAVLPLWTGHVVSTKHGVARHPSAALFPLFDTYIMSSVVHQMDALENLFVPGRVLHVEDMYDGMVLTSLSGYDRVIQLNPLRIDNVNVEVPDSNIYFKNGVVHGINNYPFPIVPWVGKSMLDVLMETNDARGGDLSDFIALIGASPNITTQMELGEGDKSATTLFVPTNYAMASLDLTQLADPSVLQQLLLNHTVAGNFAKRFWKDIPTGTVVSSTELTLETQAGQVLVLSINETDVGVTINGVTTIVQSDIFCEQGILQVIDRVLG